MLVERLAGLLLERQNMSCVKGFARTLSIWCNCGEFKRRGILETCVQSSVVCMCAMCEPGQPSLQDLYV